MEKKTQNQMERNREIIRNIKLAYKSVNPESLTTDKINTQESNNRQIKRKS